MMEQEEDEKPIPLLSWGRDMAERQTACTERKQPQI